GARPELHDRHGADLGPRRTRAGDRRRARQRDASDAPDADRAARPDLRELLRIERRAARGQEADRRGHTAGARADERNGHAGPRGRQRVRARGPRRLPRPVVRRRDRHGRAPRRVPESGLVAPPRPIRPRARRRRRPPGRHADPAARGALLGAGRERDGRGSGERGSVAAGRARRDARRPVGRARGSRSRRPRDRRRAAARAAGTARRGRACRRRRGRRFPRRRVRRRSGARRAVIPRYFIDRPVFAWVIALTILLAGLLALRALPIEQYPSIAPPSLTIEVTYPGADASVLETNVTQVIEQELNGVEGFLYMSSTSRSSGTASIDVTFESGTDIDVAQMDVQNRLRAVEARLPEEVRRQGI